MLRSSGARLGLILLLVLAHAFAVAVAGITGTVTTQNPAVSPQQSIGNMSVSLIQGGVVVDATTTDVFGDYSFSGTTAGTYALEFSKPNYVKTRVLNVVLTDGQVLVANVSVTPALKLSANGVDNANQLKKWKVRNQHSFNVDYTWEDLDSGATGSGTAAPGDNLLNTPLNASGPTRIRLLVNDIQVRANSGTTTDLAPLNGTVSGTVRDLSNVAISGATITLTNIDTNDVVATSTGLDGMYAFNDVPAGAYSVNATGTNLNSSTVGVTVNAGESQVVDFSLYLVAVVTIHVTVFGNPSSTSTVGILFNDSSFGPFGQTDANGNVTLTFQANKPCGIIIGITFTPGPAGGFPVGPSTFNVAFPLS